MKKPILITVLVVLLVGGYFVYQHYFSKPKITLWDLVPPETVLVYESSECAACLQDLRNSPVVKVIKSASIRTEKDSLYSIQDLILSFQQPTLVSLHITRKDEFDFTYYVNNSANFQQKVSMLFEQLRSMKGIKIRQREFNAVQINEITFARKTFSYALIESVWVGSFSPILVEDVIRTYKSEKKNSFKDVISSVYQLPRIKNDGGNLYVHLHNLSQWLSLFTKESSSYLVDHFGHSSLLDAKIDDNKLILNGFSFHPLNRTDFFLSAFQQQNPVEFKIKNLISNRTLLLNDFGISNGKEFFKRLNEISKNPHSDSLAILTGKSETNLISLLHQFSGEIAVSHLESRRESLTRVMLIHDDKNISAWMTAFKDISSSLSTDSLFVDQYGTYEIFEMPAYNFPEKLFYPLVTGFNSSYYTQVGNALCVGENIEELKKFLDDIDQENTWGKSVAQNRFLESTLLESSVSIFINTPRIWHMLGMNLQPRWQDFVELNKSNLSALGMAAIQFSHLNDTYYTNVCWAFREPKEEPRRETSDRYITNFQSGIARFAVAQSHLDNSREALIQDSLKTLSLVSDEGKILWQLPLGGLISGKIHQVDYFNNGKLQYFFATPGQLHIVDRLGKYVKPFPVDIKETEIDHVSVIDYDHSKKYRFLLASKDGKLWMYDKEGTNLEGWQPRVVDEQLATAVNHHRILGRDYLVAVRKDGFIYLMNRRGELLKNFPLDLNTTLQGDYFLEIGRKTSDTYITVISTDGIKYKFNLHGTVQSKDVMLKNSPEARFRLVTESKFKSYLVLRSEAKLFTVFDESSNEIINSDYIANNTVDVSYYSFGGGKDYIVATDVNQRLSFIFDRKGKLVTPIPIDCRELKVFPTDGDKVKVYFIDDKNVTIAELP